MRYQNLTDLHSNEVYTEGMGERERERERQTDSTGNIESENV